MKCPKCNGGMETIDHAGVEVDRCKSCQGIWFDIGERDSMRHRELATAIDTGDPLVGKESNRITNYRCPRCNGGMMRVVDPRRKDVWFEECTACRGSFFDAGEFSDLNRDTVSEILVLATTRGG